MAVLEQPADFLSRYQTPFLPFCKLSSCTCSCWCTICMGNCSSSFLHDVWVWVLCSTPGYFINHFFTFIRIHHCFLAGDQGRSLKVLNSLILICAGNGMGFITRRRIARYSGLLMFFSFTDLLCSILINTQSPWKQWVKPQQIIQVGLDIKNKNLHRQLINW